MKMHVAAVLLLAFVAACLAVPQNKRQDYDESRLSNEVIPGVNPSFDEIPQDVTTSTESSTDESTQSETTKKPELDDPPTPRPGNKRKKQNSSPPASDTFSRVIDDIFNIPISVLRAVNTLLSNAFGSKPTETAASSAAATPPVSK